MSAKGKLVQELKRLTFITLYFAAWFGLIILLKKLLLAQYGIAVNQIALALVGAVVLAKVVVLMEHIPMEAWVRHQPAIVGVLLRTFMYSLGVLVVLTLEKAFEARHEYGGFARALTRVYQHPEYPKVLFNTICMGVALLGFNILSVLQEHFGINGLRKLFFARPEGRGEQTADEAKLKPH